MLIKITSINENEKVITNEKSYDEWLSDFWGECNFVPYSDDDVIFVSIDGKELNLQEIANKSGDGELPLYFEHVANYLRFRD